MKVLDLFSGIGGFSLGLERAGMQTVAFCEIDKFCQKVLAKHWPTVPIYDDVTSLTAERLKADGILVDVICGGFPCQDISTAGKGEGLNGKRSGLWREYARLIGELRPQYVIVENVAALLFRGLSDVLGDLASLGYDAEWHCIPASHIGAPHRRDRIWIVAYPNSNGQNRPENAESNRQGNDATASRSNVFGKLTRSSNLGKEVRGSTRKTLAYPDRSRWQGSEETGNDAEVWSESRDQLIAGCGGISRRTWETEPDVGRVAHGIPARMDRLKSLGNAVVPQIPEILGKAIMSHALRDA